MRREDFTDLLRNRILVLDGAMGTLLQRHQLPASDFGGAKGNYDYLNITRPDIVMEAHLSYLQAGADIIETNTFSSNRFSQEAHNSADKVYELNRKGAEIAQQAIAQYLSTGAKRAHKPLVAGSMGPMIKSLSIPSDLNRPDYRAISFDLMAQAYKEQVCGLIDGGADLLLMETIYDALNAKAALYAIEEVLQERGIEIPVMVSATINDKSGRLLSGHRWEALFNALSSFPIASFGLNCSFGAEELGKIVEEIALYRGHGWENGLPCAISIYPNAGLPNELGEYNETPEQTAGIIGDLARRGLINIAGGCCGTTPEHIKAIAESVKGLAPRSYQIQPILAKGGIMRGYAPAADSMCVSGWESLEINRIKNNFINVGERTNVAGSAKFARLIREGQYQQAVDIARKQIEDGATIIDINTDDPMSNGRVEMQRFLRWLLDDPQVAKVPFMIDSSDWETVLVALKECGGKAIVNSISLKEGEEIFIQKANQIRNLGAAVVVMAFDQEGQAVTFERKIEICGRAYKILTEQCGFTPNNIIFDVNVLSVATGIEEHEDYAVDFIKAVAWIKQNLPGCKTSGGISNLSFSFRGNNRVREAMHSIFLYHAIAAGLDMAIVNPSMLQIYSNIEPELLKCAEDVILNRHTAGEESTPTERLVALAQRIKEEEAPKQAGAGSAGGAGSADAGAVAAVNPEEQLFNLLLKGSTEGLQENLMEALKRADGDAVSLIEGPLMRGMGAIGELFGEGKMFLPQVVKSAKVMKGAVDLLKPYMQKGSAPKHPGKIVTATVKGDIHDIGKNIVCIVLECNNMEVVDLGVMVDSERILEEAIAQKADFVGVSGLITPSLTEMENLCKLFEKNRGRIMAEVGHQITIIVGGAATSQLHTAVKLAPHYPNGVIYGGDASLTALQIKRILSSSDALQEILAEQRKIRALYYKSSNNNLLTPGEARTMAPQFGSEDFEQAPQFGKQNLEALHIDINELVPYMDWPIFYGFWGLKGSNPEETASAEQRTSLRKRAMEELERIAKGQEFDAGVVLHFYNVHREGEQMIIESKVSSDPQQSGIAAGSILLPRQLKRNSEHLSAADYLPQNGSSRAGLFTLKVTDNRAGEYNSKEFDYLLRQSLCAALTEGLAEWMQEKISFNDNIIRVAIGYPMCPDHNYKRLIFNLTDAGAKLELGLTESCSIVPSTAICGIIISHKRAKYHI